MKMGEQRVFPSAINGFRKRYTFGVRHNCHCLGIGERALACAVCHFETGLRGITAGSEVVKLVIDHGECVANGFGFLEEFTKRAELDGREDRPRHHFIGAFYVATGRAAAVVADAVNDQPRFKAARALGDIENACADLGGDAAVVPILLAVAKII